MRKTKEVFGHRELWAAALLVVSAGCGTGNVGSAGGKGGTASGSGGTSNTGGTNAGGGTAAGGNNGATGGTGGMGAATPSGMTGAAGTIGNVAAGPLDSGRVAMRRLNDREYDNTMRDLLGTTQTLAATTFPGDNVDDGFDTVGSALSYSDKLLAQQFAASTTLVNELVSRTATDPLKTAIFSCTPTAANMATCLPQILTTFMPKAWRRPVTTAEVTTAAAVGTAVLTSAQSATAAGGTDPATAAVSAALQYVLMSPNFLYHVEIGSPAIVPASSATTPLSNYEVASRLSYFLWSTMPDATLTQAAAAGQLVNAAGISTQVTRMIADAKFSAFISGFVDPWIGVNEITANVTPDPMVFPNATMALINSFGPETEAFVSNLITTKAPLTELLTADYTFANGTLAKFYGVQGVPATQTTFTKVSLAGTQRTGGILTQETFLTTTSVPTRTSPVKRGAYVLSQLVCDPPQPPPPGVPALVVAATGQTVRQALNMHASIPSCAGCHASIDPIGFTFENFDAMGTYRTTDNGVAIDATGSLYSTATVNGANVDGAQGMAQAIAADPRFVDCIVKNALTFGTGRTYDAADALGYVETVATPLQKGGTWEGALQAIATSQAFMTMRGGQ
ncbi:MAG: DUF1592 domain-containing protein [Polyangiaceae bacterium]